MSEKSKHYLDKETMTGECCEFTGEKKKKN